MRWTAAFCASVGLYSTNQSNVTFQNFLPFDKEDQSSVNNSSIPFNYLEGILFLNNTRFPLLLVFLFFLYEMNTNTASVHAKRIEEAIVSKTLQCLQKDTKSHVGDREFDSATTQLPGCCFLVSGPSGSGKHSLMAQIVDDFAKALNTETTIEKCTFALSFAALHRQLKQNFDILLQAHHINSERALKDIFLNDSTHLHREIFKDIYLPNPKGNSSQKRKLTINVAVWDNFELLFAKNGGVPSESAGGGTQKDDNGGPEGVNLIPDFDQVMELTSSSAVDCNNRNTFSNGNDSRKLPFVVPLTASPELLTHFLSLSQKIAGKALGFYPLEPKVVSETNKNKTQASNETSLVITFLFALTTSKNLDPILLNGPAFDYQLDLATPTEDERRHILGKALKLSNSPQAQKTNEAILSAVAARTGGCSMEYVTFAGKYIATQLATFEKALHNGNALSLLVGNTLGDFDRLWTVVSSNTNNGGADRKSRIGYTDVQKVLWADIAGLSEAKAALKKLVLSVKHKEKYLAHGVSPSIGAILHGPPGTGKTMLAKAMATEMLASFVYLDLPELINGAIGESERILREFFATAKERSPCIMFIDEIQSAFSKRYDAARGGNNSAHDARLVASLLSLLDEARQCFFTHPVVFIGATNWIEVIDEAVLRAGRLDTHIFVGLPDALARESLIRHYMSTQWTSWIPTRENTITGENYGGHALTMVDVLVATFLEATNGMTGAEVKNSLNEFAIRLFVGDGYGARVTSDADAFYLLFQPVNDVSELRPEVLAGIRSSCQRRSL